MKKRNGEIILGKIVSATITVATGAWTYMVYRDGYSAVAVGMCMVATLVGVISTVFVDFTDNSNDYY